MFKKTIRFVAVTALVFALSSAAQAQFTSGFESPTYNVGFENLIPQDGWAIQFGGAWHVQDYEGLGGGIPWTPQSTGPSIFYPPVNPTGGDQYVGKSAASGGGGGRAWHAANQSGLVEVSVDYCNGPEMDYPNYQGSLVSRGNWAAGGPGNMVGIYFCQSSTYVEPEQPVDPEEPRVPRAGNWAFNVMAFDEFGVQLKNVPGIDPGYDPFYRFNEVEGFDELPRESWWRVGYVVDMDPQSDNYRKIVQLKSQDLTPGGDIWIMDNPQALQIDPENPEPPVDVEDLISVDMYIHGGAESTDILDAVGIYNVGNGSVSVYDNIYAGAPYEWQVVYAGPPILVWRTDEEDDWTSMNWTPDEGENYNAPAGDEIMVVNSGIVTVSTDTTVLDPAVSLLIGRDAPGGTVVIGPSGVLSVGDVDVGVGATLNVNGELSAGGLDVTGGTLGLGDGAMIKSPLAAPDSSSVTMTVDGTLNAGGGVAMIGDEENDLGSTNLTLADGSTFNWTFSSGDDYVDVFGEVIIEGALTIQLVDGGGTASGADVALFRALDVSILDLSSVEVLSPAGTSWSWATNGSGDPSFTFNGEFLFLQGLSTGVAGDINGDLVVNDEDLALFEAQFGGTPAGADFDGDGDVDLADLAVIRGNWGFGTGGAPFPGLNVTPEPATMGLLALGGLALIRRRRRRF